jgi:hypothetical protein
MTPLSKIWWESLGVKATYMTIKRVILFFLLLLLVWHFGLFSGRGFSVAAISRRLDFRRSGWGCVLYMVISRLEEREIDILTANVS